MARTFVCRRCIRIDILDVDEHFEVLEFLIGTVPTHNLRTRDTFPLLNLAQKSIVELEHRLRIIKPVMLAKIQQSLPLQLIPVIYRVLVILHVIDEKLVSNSIIFKALEVLQ